MESATEMFAQKSFLKTILILKFVVDTITINDLINAHSQINASYLKKKRPPMRCEVYITPPL